MSASEILSLAARAGIAPGVSVLDVCCGVAGPGRLITRELGCTYVGVDARPVPSTSHVSAPPTSAVASRSRGSRRSLQAP